MRPNAARHTCERNTKLIIAFSVALSLHLQVMDGGNVAEFGVPHDLLQNPASHLLSLVEATGPASAAHLKAVARAAWENRKAGRPARLAREQIQRLEEQNALDSAAATGLLMSSDGGVDTSCVRFHSDDAESAL